MKIKAIFYDFDGVIKESTEIKTEAFYELYMPYGKTIAEQAKSYHLDNGGISRFEKFKHIHQEFLNINLDEGELNELAEAFSRLVLKKVIGSKYVPGSLNLIQSLSHKFDQYIVTGTPQNEIEFIIKKLNISHLFKGVYGSPKSKISISKSIISQERYQSHEVLFIGDANTDYQAATHLNFHFILREHAENKVFFENIDVVKSKDLSNLEKLINTIQN